MNSPAFLVKNGDPRRYQTWKLWFLQATDLWTASSTLEAARWSVSFFFSLKRGVFFFRFLEKLGGYGFGTKRMIYKKQPLPKRGLFSGVRGYVVDSWEFLAEGWGFWSFIKWRLKIIFINISALFPRVYRFSRYFFYAFSLHKFDKICGEKSADSSLHKEASDLEKSQVANKRGHQTF